MMEYIKPKFPAFDIDYKGSMDYIKEDPLFIDEFYYSKSNDYFNNEILNHTIIDSNGNTFKIVGKKDLSGIIRFLPFSKKAEYIFEKLEKKYTLEELKLILNKFIDNKEIQENMIKAKNIEDLFLGR
ncbi:hypothetical protein [Chryseobacterium paridis]|uniref:Uncharacterized protein n=1 Tax=Chryseobacterium paridis TaxID=2800328 RepID=A0ABS1FW95_9FLAO|nr:hypothetical protein [Chryseobacterium paridis]MBK1896677.1 hypothetical protein [Chryseobacterium paridis]